MQRKDEDVECLSQLLEKTSIPSESGLSFAHKCLFKTNELQDAKEVVDEIEKCEHLTYLNLEGNSLGVEAAKEISKALEKRSEFKKAIWKDMFTSRLKTEIPQALRYLGKALIMANAKLEVLDLSDNASGPIGVEGFKELLSSPVCYSLKELKLNNMGLGITGGEMLASALMDCYKKSKAAGTPLSLKVFVAGRNRLENQGAIALANVFKELKSLEVISVRQNGIYDHGIKALSAAFAENKNLQHIDLNDNNINLGTSKYLAEVLGQLKHVKTLDFGSCLVKSKGVCQLLKAIPFLTELEDLNLSENEINSQVGTRLISVLMTLPSLKTISLNGNNFGPEACCTIQKIVKDQNKSEILTSLSDDEGENDEENDNEDDEDEEEEEDDDEEEEEEEEEEELEDDIDLDEDDEDEEEDDSNVHGGHLQGVSPMLRDLPPAPITTTTSPFVLKPTKVDALTFLNQPSTQNFLGLQSDEAKQIIEELTGRPEQNHLSDMMEAIMTVSSLVTECCNGGHFNQSLNHPGRLCKEVQESALRCTELLYTQMFSWAKQQTSVNINNTLPVYLGLIKEEKDTYYKCKKFNKDGCIAAIKNAIAKNIVPVDTRNIIEMCLNRRILRK